MVLSVVARVVESDAVLVVVVDSIDVVLTISSMNSFVKVEVVISSVLESI